ATPFDPAKAGTQGQAHRLTTGSPLVRGRTERGSTRGGGTMSDYDVIVVGGGNAAFCAALAAQEVGAKVVMLEAAPEEVASVNSRFTAGSIRVVYNGVEDIKTLIPD